MAVVLCKAAKKVILSPKSLVGNPAQYMTSLHHDHREYNFSIGTKCDTDERSYDDLHPLVNIGKFTIHLTKQIGKTNIVCPNSIS